MGKSKMSSKKVHAAEVATSGPLAKMKAKPYEAEMKKVHGELVALQEWVKSSGAKIVIVFEGRDTAGEVVIFDRSWYNRAGVEPVMGFCTPEQSAEFLRWSRALNGR